MSSTSSDSRILEAISDIEEYLKGNSKQGVQVIHWLMRQKGYSQNTAQDAQNHFKQPNSGYHERSGILYKD